MKLGRLGSRLDLRGFARRILAAAICTLLALPLRVSAQQCQQWSPVGVWHGVNGDVNAIANWTNDRVIIAGSFSAAGEAVAAPNIALYQPGANWTTIGEGINGPVNALLVLPNGDFIAGGSFTEAGGAPVLNIARFRAADNAWSPLGSGTSGPVNALALLPDGEIVAGGSFATAGGISVNCVARFSPASGLWSALGTGVSGTQPYVAALDVLADGRLVVGGNFLTIGAAQIRHVAIYSFAENAWSGLGVGVSGRVAAVAAHPDGTIFVGGQFVSAGGLPCPRFARFDLATQTWAALGTQLAGYTPYFQVRALRVLPDNRVGVSGNFYGASTLPADCVAIFDPKSGAWTGLQNPGLVPLLSSFINAICPQPDGSLLFGGNVTSPTMHVGRWTPPYGAFDLGDGVHFGPAYTVCPLPDGRLVVGGLFTSVSELPVKSVAMYDPAALRWIPLGAGFDGLVRCIIRLGDDTLIAGGDFTHTGSSQVNGIAWYDWNADRWLPLGDGVTDKPPFWQSTIGVHDACELPGRRLVVCGVFAKAGGLPVSGVAIYDFNSEQWIAPPAAGGSLSYPVTAACALNDGSFAVCSLQGALKRLDRQFQLWSSLGTFEADLNPSLFDLALLQGGDLLVGGTFTSVSGTPASGLARLNLATGQWSSVGGSFTRVVAMKRLSDNDILVCDDNLGAMFRGHLETNSWQSLTTGAPLSVPKACDELFIDGERSFVVGANTLGSGFRAVGIFHDGGPVVLAHTAPDRLCRMMPARFTVETVLPGSLQFRWQIETESSLFVDLQDGPLNNVGVVSGSNTESLSISDLRPGASTRFRCLVFNSCAAVITDPDPLTLCLSDQNCDGVSDLLDFFAFFNAWDTTDIHADIDGDGQVDLIDFFAFFNGFDAQC